MEITLSAANDTEFTVEVDYTVSGGFRPATREDPPEYPEVEYDYKAVLTLKNGKKIAYDLSKLPQKLLDKIQEACEEDASRNDGPDYEPDDYDFDDFNPNVDCGTDSNGRDRDYGRY
jgi:hypothetical protein